MSHHQLRFLLLSFVHVFTILCSLYCDGCEAFVATTTTSTTTSSTTTTTTTTVIPQNEPAIAGKRIHRKDTFGTTRRSSSSSSSALWYNVYDDWRSDAVVDTMHLDEENVVSCLEEFVESDYGTTMFGCHARAAVIGITGSIEFVETCGPEVTLSLSGKFWHKRSTVLGRAAVYLNARIPEITDVVVADLEDLKDFEEITDEYGDVLFRKDKRSEDFNGDRDVMEYQGIDPDQRGPFPSNPMGSGGLTINPA